MLGLFTVFVHCAVFRIFQDISNHSRNIKSLEFCNAVDGNHELRLQKHKVKMVALFEIVWNAEY